ncbi:hypothetical protein AJ87_07175 [Rhizobium yanglingense]|nr:hypothetical protein AJ87_07175 [Rhizobium yanglingense]
MGVKAHDLLEVMSLASIILPSEVDMLVIDGDDATVGDGHPMRVSAEISEHLVRPAETRLGVDDPFWRTSVREMAGESGGVGKVRKRVGEAKFTLCEGISKGSQKEPPEYTRQNSDGQEEARPACNPL